MTYGGLILAWVLLGCLLSCGGMALGTDVSLDFPAWHPNPRAGTSQLRLYQTPATIQEVQPPDTLDRVDLPSRSQARRS